MKKLLLAVALLGGLVAQAQISTGETTAQVVRTGNRATEGDFGIYFGATSDMVKDLISKDTKITALPLINLKYMCSDKVEARLGFQWYAKNQITDYYEPENNDDYDYVGKQSNKSNSVMFYPGVAYHFNKSNILDVYVGGELPIGGAGLGRNYYADDEDDSVQHYSATQFNIGLGAFIGLQAYICNLPLAIGFEYGVSCMYNHLTNGRFSQDGYTINDNTEVSRMFKDNKFRLGNQARLTLSYYFKL